MKKFLSLVLALVMTMSLVTISAGATDVAKNFTDKGKIQYNDAVDVVSAAKIIDGYTDGSFAPTGTLTRGAAAKIICNMVLGPTTASALGVDAKPFKDVAVDNVFAGYIAYCSQQGIINGYADGNFRPAGLVTGNQFMKMLLGALGYDGSIEGFTGANWTVAVIKLAKSLELDDGNDAFVGSKAMTREEACLYAFNTLKATMVEYKDNSTISVGNITISNKSKATEVEDNNNKKGTYKKDELLQFCEKYFDKLTGKSATDDFGRPATKWSYDGDSIGTYADDADDTMVVAKARTAEQVVLTDSDYFAYATGDVNSNVVLYVNGVETSTTKAGLTGVTLKAGDQVEVFEDDDDNVKTVAVIRYSLAKIDEVSTSLSSTYTKKGASASITLQGLDDASIGGTYYDKYDGDSAKELPGFSADTYKADAVLAIAKNPSDKILDSYVATAAEGKVTAYNSGDKATVTAGGTEYKMHEIVNTKNGDRCSVNALVSGNALDFNYNDSTYTVYTDVNGYVIGINETESVKIEDVYYVTCLTKGNSLYQGTIYAQAVALKDGSVTEFKLKKDSTDNNAAFGTDWDATANYNTDNIYDAVAGLYTFDKDGSSYTAERYNSASDGTYYVYGTYATTGGTANGRLPDKAVTGSVTDATALVANPVVIGGDLKSDDSSMTIGQKVYLNKDTNYVKVEDVGDGISVKTVTGGTSVKKAYNGNDTKAIAVTTKVNNNYVASYVILVSAKFSNASSDNVVFVHEYTNTAASYTDANGKSKTGYSTELYYLEGSGKVETVTTDKRYDAGFYTWEKNDDSVIELTAYTEALPTLTAAYDDETGYVGFTGASSHGLKANDGVKLTGIYNSTSLSATYTNNRLDDVDFAKNVIIADDRGQSTRDADLYTTEVTSVGTLKSAIDKSGNEVNAILYYDDGAVVMVYVMSMTNAVNNTVNAVNPVMTNALPATATYVKGAVATALNATSTVTDAGTVSYQWYKNGAAIVGAIQATYTPATDVVGTATYKCIVTNTNTRVNGDQVATISDETAVTVTNVKHTVSANISGTVAVTTDGTTPATPPTTSGSNVLETTAIQVDENTTGTLTLKLKDGYTSATFTVQIQGIAGTSDYTITANQPISVSVTTADVVVTVNVTAAIKPTT